MSAAAFLAHLASGVNKFYVKVFETSYLLNPQIDLVYNGMIIDVGP